MKIGVIGVGVIGGALYSAAQDKGFEVVGYDKFKQGLNSDDNLNEVLKSDIAFVCVPTLTVDRMQDLEPVQNVFSTLSFREFKGVVCLRCTVLPGTTAMLKKKYSNLRVVHNPEFLTAAKPVEDLLKQPAVLLGSDSKDDAMVVAKFWKEFDSNVPVLLGQSTETELAKYAHNCFLAAKVSFFNDLYEICLSADVKYDAVMELAHAIGQIGRGHTRVPGPETDKAGNPLFGFGGECFPKDTSALSFWCELKGIPAETLNGAIKGNNRRRG